VKAPRLPTVADQQRAAFRTSIERLPRIVEDVRRDSRVGRAHEEWRRRVLAPDAQRSELVALRAEIAAAEVVDRAGQVIRAGMDWTAIHTARLTLERLRPRVAALEANASRRHTELEAAKTEYQQMFGTYLTLRGELLDLFPAHRGAGVQVSLSRQHWLDSRGHRGPAHAALVAEIELLVGPISSYQPADVTE
jgi:hypothetical protein